MEHTDTGRAVAIGNFDGVHCGHRLLLGQLKQLATEHGLQPAVVTFTRHPLQVIAPERAPRMLQTPQQRRHMLESAGLEVIELDFDERLRRLSAAEFLRMLRQKYDVRLLMLGHDTRFGFRSAAARGRGACPVEEYRSIGSALGMEVAEAPQLPEVSSSAVRRCIAAGDVEKGARMLGRPYSFAGTVVRGHRIGRTIGFPTANLAVTPASTLLPAVGVYVARTQVDGKLYRALVNIGHRPTVDVAGAPLSVEVYIDGFSGDLYGRELTVEFVHRLRGEHHFPSLEALQAQLAKDREALACASL